MKYGEIIQLGRHRLMCGDATNKDDVMRLIDGARINLVLQGPPYGMNVLYRGSNGNLKKRKKFLEKDGRIKEINYGARYYGKLVGDENSDSAKKNYEITKDIAKKLIFWGGNYFSDFLPVSGAWIFWDKENGASDFSDGELAWTNCGKRVRKYVHRWSGMMCAGSSLLNNLGGTKKHDTRSRCHPTQKPVELHAKILEDFSQENENILDCFGGSGTTLIACEITNRNCFMMEIVPEYCDVIISRYNKLKEREPMFNK